MFKLYFNKILCKLGISRKYYYYRRPIGDPWQTDIPDRRSIKDPTETDMRSPIRIQTGLFKYTYFYLLFVYLFRNNVRILNRHVDH